MRRSVLIALMLAVATSVVGCQAYEQRQQAKRAMMHKLAVREDRGRILVSTGPIKEPYEKLGELSYTEPLNGTTIDTHHINAKLRNLAISRWGDSVDAIIDVKTRVAGTSAITISVSGEAVKIKGNGSGWRHSSPAAPPV